MEHANAQAIMDASIIRGGSSIEGAHAEGLYTVRCFDKDGNLKWADDINNVVMSVGKNLMLDSTLSTAVTVVGPYMGLISSVGFSTIGTVVDTMASHAGWAEAGTGSDYPLYTGSRMTCVWSAASTGSKALSAALSYVIAGTGGTVKGCFIVTGTGAVSTIGSSAGTLLSAGLFTGGDKIVAVADTLQVSYTMSL
jgi:hypothetical protein